MCRHTGGGLLHWCGVDEVSTRSTGVAPAGGDAWCAEACCRRVPGRRGRGRGVGRGVVCGGMLPAGARAERPGGGGGLGSHGSERLELVVEWTGCRTSANLLDSDDPRCRTSANLLDSDDPRCRTSANLLDSDDPRCRTSANLRRSADLCRACSLLRKVCKLARPRCQGRHPRIAGTRAKPGPRPIRPAVAACCPLVGRVRGSGAEPDL